MTHKIGQPRFIQPSLVEIGDDIAVEHKSDKGVTLTLRGVVGQRIDDGNTRYLATEEGSTLLAWDEKENKQVKITLYGRAEYEQSTLDLLDQLRERI